MQLTASPGVMGIGIDIEEVDRFNSPRSKRDNAFLAKVFTRKELDYCLSKEHGAMHLAARFAGKEAVIKAMSEFTDHPPSQKEVEILSEGGIPRVRLKNGAGKDLIIKVSLSHSNEYVVAIAIVQEVSRWTKNKDQ